MHMNNETKLYENNNKQWQQQQQQKPKYTHLLHSISLFSFNFNRTGIFFWMATNKQKEDIRKNSKKKIHAHTQ